jgi:hypothetical protein
MSRPPRLPPEREEHAAILALLALARARGLDFVTVALGETAIVTLDIGERTAQPGGRQASVCLISRLGSANALATPVALADALLDRLAECTFAVHRGRETLAAEARATPA